VQAAYIDSHERPQDPRFTGDLAETTETMKLNITMMAGCACLLLSSCTSIESDRNLEI
jgi:hypothetical protein